ncbi:MAG: glycosyltransferase family 4 protein [Actinomycetaceae bacterium]|nr:glycosyltransferase family 4 protein [Actinomycetaceae bacterium]MDY6082328.1 glycosyltransferase family 4 protein [Actinomycetaceae bacterium]
MKKPRWLHREYRREVGDVLPVGDVQVVSRIFSPEPAAASFRLEALVKALVKAGQRVSVLTSLPAPGKKRHVHAHVDQLPGVYVKRVQALRDETGYIRGYLPYMSFDIPSFFRLLFSPRPQIYVSEPPPTTGAMVRVLSALKRRPYAYYAADVWSDAASDAPQLVVKALRLAEGFALHGASCVLAISDAVASRCRDLGAQHVTLVPNGIDTDVFTDRGDMPQPVGGADPRDGDWFVYAGTYSEWQGAEIFAEAFTRIADHYPQARLLFLGQGTSREALQRIADAPGGEHIYFGKVSPDQAAGWQRIARACLVSIKPGNGYDFAYPTKVFAALACNTPVLYAGVGPAKEDIERNGLGVAAPYDVQAVANAMRSILDGTLTYAHMREWVVEHHSVAATAQKAATAILDAIRH